MLRPRAFFAALAVVVGSAAWVRAFHPAPFPSDLDEAFQVKVITSSPAEFWRILKEDAVHPPLDYLIDRAVLSLSRTAIRRRIPHVLWGCLTVAIFGLLLRNRAGPAAGLAGAALLALAPYHVVESRRLRPYALGAMLLCLSLYLLDRLLDRPGRSRAALFGVAAGACLSTLYVAGIVLAVASAALGAEALLWSDTEARERAKRALPLIAGAGLLALALFAPWLPTALDAARRPPVAQAPPENAARPGRILSYLAFSPNSGYSFPPRALFVAGIVLAAALVAAGAAFAFSGDRTRFLAFWAGGGLLATEILKRIHPHFDSFRYFLPAGIAVAALWGIAFARLHGRAGSRALAWVALAAVISLDGVSLARYYRFGVWDFSSGRTKTTSSAFTRPSFSRAFFSSS